MARNHPTALYLNDPVKWIAGVLSIRQALSLAGVAVLTYVLIKLTGGLPYNSSTVGQVHLLLVAGIPGVLAFLAWSLLDKGAVEPYPRQLAGYLLRTTAALPARGATTARRIRVANIERARTAPPWSPWSPWSSRLPRLVRVVHLPRRARPGSPVRAVPTTTPTDMAPVEARGRRARANREARRWRGRAPHVRRRTPAALTDDGTLTCPGVGPRVWLEIAEGVLLSTLSGEAQDRFTAMFSAVVTLPPGYHLQFTVLSTPLAAGAVIDDAFADVRPPTPALADLATRLRAWWEAHLRGKYVPTHRFLLVVTGPARQAAGAAGTSLEQVASEVQRGVRRMGVAARRLDGPAVKAILDAYPDTPGRRPVETLDDVHPRVPEVTMPSGDAAGSGAPGTAGPAGPEGAAPAWHARSFYVIVPPQTTHPGWLAPILAFPAPLRLAIHITGLDQDKERRRTKGRSRSLADVMVGAHVRGREADVDAVDARAEARAQAKRMRSAGAAVVRAGIYVTVFAPDRASLQTRADALWSVLTSTGAIAAKGARARGHQGLLHAATQPLGLDPARSVYKVEADTIANAWPAISHTPGHADGLLLGTSVEDGSLVRVNIRARSLKNRLLSTFGGSGQGKSFFVQMLMLWFMIRDAWVTAIDTVGGYETLATIAGGPMIRLGGPATASINIWDGPRATPEDLAARTRFVVRAHEVLLSAAGRPLDDLARAAVGEGVRAVYNGFRAPGAACDDDRPADGTPLERDLVAWLDGQAVDQDDPEDRRLYKTLAARLRSYARGGEHAALVDRATSFAIDAHVLAVQIDRKQLGTDTPIYAFAMFALTDLVDRRHALAKAWYARQRRGTVEHFLAWDEGWALLKHAAGQEWVSGTGLTGRHDAVISDFVSQKISHLAKGAAADYFDQASLHFIFNMHDTNDESGVDPRAWVKNKLRLTEAMAARVDALEGEERKHSQLLMIRTTKYGQPAVGVVNVPETLKEVYWTLTSDPDDKEVRERMLRVVAADPDHPTGDEVWTAVCLLASGTRPEAIEGRRARTAALRTVAGEDDAGDNPAAEAADDTEEARLWLVRQA